MPTSLASLVADHGYWLIALGLLLEGETAVLGGAIAAQRGLLWLPAVLALAACGAWLSDQAWYWTGRLKGRAWLSRHPRLAPALARAEGLVARHPQACVLGVRFAWGMRVAGPALIGASGLPPLRFAAWSGLAALAWAGALCAAGWFFGAAAARWLAGALAVQPWLLGGAAGLALAVWLLRRRRARRAGEGEGGRPGQP